MHHHLAHLLSTYGYWGLCGGLALEYLFIPIPGETTLTTVGILWQNPNYHLQLFWLLLSTTAGTFSGAMFGYLVGRALGRPFLIRFGKYIRLTPERVDKIGKLFTKYTVPTLVFSRYIAGVRIIVPYIAGINRVRLLVFVPVMLISSLMWTATFILAGSVIEKAWARFIANWQRNLIPALIVLLFVVALYIYIHRWMKRKLEVEDSDDAADESPTSDSDSTRLP